MRGLCARSKWIGHQSGMFLLGGWEIKEKNDAEGSISDGNPVYRPAGYACARYRADGSYVLRPTKRRRRWKSPTAHLRQCTNVAPV